jgi:hypothetical protein
LKQLIAQLLHQNPEVVLSNPSVFSRRSFRKATTLRGTLDLLVAVVGTLESLVIVLDRLDLCAPDDTDPARTRQPDMALALALTMLMGTYPQSLRILVTSAGIASPESLPGLPFSFAKVNTRRRPRKRNYEYSRIKEVEYERLRILPKVTVELRSTENRLIPHGGAMDLALADGKRGKAWDRRLLRDSDERREKSGIAPEKVSREHRASFPT